MSPALPWFEATADSPAVPDGVACLMLTVPATVAASRPAALPVSGTFQMSERDAAELPREDPFAALTLLVVEVGSARSMAFRPARSAVGPETQPVPPGMRRGWFHADVFGQTGFVPRPGRYYVSAWLGALQSLAAEVCVVESA